MRVVRQAVYSAVDAAARCTRLLPPPIVRSVVGVLLQHCLWGCPFWHCLLGLPALGSPALSWTQRLRFCAGLSCLLAATSPFSHENTSPRDKACLSSRAHVSM